MSQYLPLKVKRLVTARKCSRQLTAIKYKVPSWLKERGTAFCEVETSPRGNERNFRTAQII
jgi:hypothetical protein